MVDGGGLGTRVHRTQASPIVGWLVFSVGVVLMVAWAGVSAAMSMERLRWTPPDGEWWIGPLVMGFFFLPFALIFAVKGYRGRVLRLDVHEGGVVFQDNTGRFAMLWDEIVGVYWQGYAHVADVGLGIGMTTHHSAKLTVVASRKAPIVIDERFPGHVKLAAYVLNAAADGMLPRIEAALQSGQRVFFGPICVDAQGIGFDGRYVPWPAVGAVRWETGGAAAWYAIYDSNGALLNKVEDALVFNQIIGASCRPRETRQARRFPKRFRDAARRRADRRRTSASRPMSRSTCGAGGAVC